MIPVFLLRLVTLSFLALIPAFLTTSCMRTEPNELDQLGTVSVTIADRVFELWIADDFEEQQRGLMFVTIEEMAPRPDGRQRGMIFVFDHERELSFWMKNTIIPLDIAYVDTDGMVVATYTMMALDDRPDQYPSGSPARFAIEFNAGVLSTLGVRAGDVIDLPDSLLNPAP